TDGSCPAFDQLVGSRIVVGNLELRLPIFGPLGVIPSRSAPPVETAFFYDAGYAWRGISETLSRDPVTSYGATLRFNIFGFAIGQLSYAHPNQRPGKGWIWEFSLVPGF
ncbi:MAG: BamA/TamA family outer membrane protein, partial [Candidatus Acidiferrales bacterium]